MTSQVTLEELGSFTGGFPFVAPVCSTQDVPGCTSYVYPPASVYTPADLVTFFQNTVPTNYIDKPPVALTSLPGPAVYSDFSVGLLGLLLGTPSGPIGTASDQGWYDLLSREIAVPLGLTDTYLQPPPDVPKGRIAAGYDPAGASAILVNGTVAHIKVYDPGENYGTAPAVSIVGGGGSGATATATVLNGGVSAIDVQSKGEGYLAPPTIAFGTTSGSPARAVAIVANGSIVAVEVTDGGSE